MNIRNDNTNNSDLSSVKEEPPLKNYLLFSMPRASTSIVLTVVDFCILFLYKKGYGLTPFLIGVSLMMGKFAIAISQSTMGWLSDKMDTRLGRRKPFMLIGAPALSISFLLLLLPPIFLGANPVQIDLFIWLLIWDVSFQFFYGFLTTPYQSWMAEQFKVNQRPKASAYQNVFNYLGTGIALLLTMVILPQVLQDFLKTQILDFNFIIILILFAIVTIVLFYLSALFLPKERTEPGEWSFIEDFKKIFEDTNFIHVCLLVGIASLTWSMITGVMLDYVNEVLKLTETTHTLLSAAILALGVITALFIWKRVIAKSGKKTALNYILLWAIIVLPFTAILPILPFENFLPPALILVGIVAAALGGWYLFPYIIFADLAENDQKSTGEKELKAGLYTGFPSILLNIFQAFGLLLVGSILELPSFPNKGYSWGYLLWGPIGSLILIIALLYLRNFITLDFGWEKDR
ncbi:MAG: MFS transporter [Promethearchaeia archaeon]